MSAKNTLVLLVIAIALAIAYFWYTQREESLTRQAEAPRRTLVSGVTSTSLERIEIKSPDKTTVTLSKRDAVWYTNPEKKHLADKNLMSGVIAVVEREIGGDVVSENPESFKEYQVSETSGTHVVLYGTGSKVLADLIVGKSGGSFFSTYVREAGRNEVVNANASLGSAFTPPGGWRDKTIVSLKSEKATAIATDGTSSTFKLSKDNDLWKMEQPAKAEVKNDKIQTFMTTFANMRAEDFVDTTQSLAELGLDPPRQKISVTAVPDEGATKTVVLLLGNQKEANGPHYVKLPDSEQVYTIADYQAKNITPSAEDVTVAPPPPPPAPAEETTSTEKATPVEKAAETTATNDAEESAEKVVPSAKETTATVTGAKPEKSEGGRVAVSAGDSKPKAEPAKMPSPQENAPSAADAKTTESARLRGAVTITDATTSGV